MHMERQETGLGSIRRARGLLAVVALFALHAFWAPEDALAQTLPVSAPLVFSQTHILTDEPAACRDNAAAEFGPVHATETYTVRLGSDPGGWARVTVFDPWDSRPILTRKAIGNISAHKGLVSVTGDYPNYSRQPEVDGWVTELRFGSSNWYVPQTVTVNIHCGRHDSKLRHKIWHRLWTTHDVVNQHRVNPSSRDTDTRDYVSTTVSVIDSAVPAEPADLNVASAYAGTLRPAIDTGTASTWPRAAGQEWTFQVSWSWGTGAHPNDWWDASKHFSSFRITVEADSSVTTPLETSTYWEESDFVIDYDKTNNSSPYTENIWHTGLYYDPNSNTNPGDPVYRLTFTPITARGNAVPGEAATICAQLQSPRATSPRAKKVVQVDCSLFVPQTSGQVEATPPTLTIAADTAEITEGGDVTFTVTADAAPGIDIAVNLGTSEEMGEGLNFVGVGQIGTVTIAADETSATWTVTTYSDDVERADGTVVGRIKPSQDYRLGEPSSVTLALLDDDGTDGGTADADGATEPTSVTTQPEPQGVPMALIAEVRRHIADFKARNHAAGIRDWTLILDRLEGRTGMSDEAIAAWLARSRLYGWQDGIVTLPKVQAALAALEAAPEPQQQPVTLPEVSVAAGASPVTEGGDAVFTFTASPTPASALSVSVNVAAGGDYGITGGSRTVTIPPTGSFTLTLATADDTADEPDGSVTVTVNDGAGYTVGSPASGTVSIEDDDLPPPVVSITAKATSATEGGAAAFTVTADRAPDADLTVTLAVSEAAGSDHVAADDEGSRSVTIATGETEAVFSVATVDDAVDEPDGSVTVTVNDGAGYTVSATPGDAATMAVSDNDAAAGPGLSVADATVTEGDQASLMEFAVRLSAPAAKRVRVRASTRVSTPVSARPKEDYWPLRGFSVSFRPGETEKTAWVYIYNDSHDEDPETFELVLSDADGAAIEDGVAVGTIVNNDPMPAAWLARFGRTVAQQALDGIAGRLAAPRTPGAQGTLAGQPFTLRSRGGDAPAPGTPLLAGLAAQMLPTLTTHGGAGASLPAGFDPGAPGRAGFGGAAARTLTLRDVLLGSSFTATGQPDAHGGSMAFWGRAAQATFEGREGAFALDGETTTAMLGTDYAQDRWLLGVTLLQSLGTGGYDERDATPAETCANLPAALTAVLPAELCNGAVREGAGSVESTLTAAVPYAAFQASERLKLWGAAGYGVGEVTLAPETGGTLKTDIAWTMAELGLRGTVLAPPPAGTGPTLAVTSDALWARTTSEQVQNGLAASNSAVTRLRLGLEGQWAVVLETLGQLTPTLAVGARHDGGDAETGFGVELGGGLAWTAPQFGLALNLEGRTLLTHRDEAFKDQGVAAAFTFDPDPTTPRGPSLTVRQDWGGQATGGVDALFAADPLTQRPGATATQSRWAAEAAWGFPAFGGHFTGNPHVGVGLAPGTRDYRLGWRLVPATPASALSLDLQATRRELDAAQPEHTVGLELSTRW